MYQLHIRAEPMPKGSWLIQNVLSGSFVDFFFILLCFDFFLLVLCLFVFILWRVVVVGFLSFVLASLFLK